MLGVFGHQALAGGYKRGNAGFHIRRATAVEFAVALGGFERRRRPFLFRPARHHIGVAGKAQQRRAVAAARPDVLGVVEVHRFNGETDFLQTLGQNGLAVFIIGGHRSFGDELFGEG